MLTHRKLVRRMPDAAVEYLLAGDGDPPIVLINGGDGPIEGWYKVLPRLIGASRTLAYSRAGIGRSSKPRIPQTSATIVERLRDLLRSLELAPPYLLVGHSLGGLHANHFARAYPGEVCALVLLDATAPGDVSLMAAHQGAFRKMAQAWLDRLFDPWSLGEARNAASSAEQVGRAGPFPDIPLHVVSGGAPVGARLMPGAAQAGRLSNQRALSRLSTRGRQILAERSGHFPQFSEPELVVSTILRALAQARRLRPEPD